MQFSSERLLVHRDPEIGADVAETAGRMIARLSPGCVVHTIRAPARRPDPRTRLPVAINLGFWRKWHRWIGFPAAIFLLFAATTGVLVAFTEFFGEEEALRERTRDMVSPVTVASAPTEWSEPIGRAIATAAARSSNAPIDRLELQFKGPNPAVTMFTGKPTGGEDRKLVFDARTGLLLSDETYADKPFLYRLHSGEVFGDGGLVVAMMWGLTLIVLTVTGLLIYFKLYRPGAKGLKKVFW